MNDLTGFRSPINSVLTYATATASAALTGFIARLLGIETSVEVYGAAGAAFVASGALCVAIKRFSGKEPLRPADLHL